MAKILKKIGALMLAFTMTVGAVGGVATDVAYGAEKVTKAEIDDAVYWCKLNPVKLALNGEKVFFKEGETPPIILNNSTLVPARTVFEGLGGTVGWHAGNQQVTVYYGDKTIILTIGSNVARVNNERKTMSVPALIADYDGDGIGSTMIPLRFTAEAIGCEVGWEDATRTAKVNSPVKEEEKTDTDKKEEETTKPSNPSKGDESTNEGTTGGNSTGNSGTETDEPEEEPYVPTYFAEDFDISDVCTTGVVWKGEKLNAAAKGKIVAIDAGHGGKDPGSIGHKGQADELYEKILNYKASIKLSEYLRAAGVTTVLLKEDDSSLALLERATIANDLGATLFVSCHNNSNVSSAPHGTEVHYYSKVDKDGKTEMELYGIESKAVAQKVRVNMTSTLGLYDRGLKSSPALAVLNKTWMPAIIIEGAFLSNEGDFAVMKNVEAYTDKYALGAAKGIIAAMNAAYK